MAIKLGMVGELLIRSGAVDSAGLNRAREAQLKTGVSLGKAFADLGLASEDAVSAAIAEGLQLECLGAEVPEIQTEIGALLPVKFCHKHLIVPLSLKGNSLRLAMADPLDYSSIQDVMFRTSKQVVPVVASQTSIIKLLNLFPSEAVEGPETYENLTGAIPEGEVVAAEDIEEVVDAAKLAKDTKPIGSPARGRPPSGCLQNSQASSRCHYLPSEDNLWDGHLGPSTPSGWQEPTTIRRQTH